MNSEPLIYSSEILDILTGQERRVSRYAGWTFTAHWCAMGLPRKVQTHPLPEALRGQAMKVIRGKCPDCFAPLQWVNTGKQLEMKKPGSLPFWANYTLYFPLEMALLQGEDDCLFPVTIEKKPMIGVYRVMFTDKPMVAQESEEVRTVYKLRAAFSPLCSSLTSQ